MLLAHEEHGQDGHHRQHARGQRKQHPEPEKQQRDLDQPGRGEDPRQSDIITARERIAPVQIAQPFEQPLGGACPDDIAAPIPLRRERREEILRGIAQPLDGASLACHFQDKILSGGACRPGAERHFDGHVAEVKLHLLVERRIELHFARRKPGLPQRYGRILEGERKPLAVHVVPRRNDETQPHGIGRGHFGAHHESLFGVQEFVLCGHGRQRDAQAQNRSQKPERDDEGTSHGDQFQQIPVFKPQEAGEAVTSRTQSR